MSKRDEVARYLCVGNSGATPCSEPCRTCGAQVAAILALLADPDDRMVDAAISVLDPQDHGIDEITRPRVEAAIRAAMKAAGE